MKYEKDIEFVKLFNRNISFLEDEKSTIPVKTTFVEKKMILIDQTSIALMVLFSSYMLRSAIDQENQQQIPNIVYSLLTFLHQKYMLIQWRPENPFKENGNFL